MHRGETQMLQNQRVPVVSAHVLLSSYAWDIVLTKGFSWSTMQSRSFSSLPWLYA